MADVRMLVSWGLTSAPPTDRYSNTLYFSVDGGVGQDPDYQALANDLRDVYAAQSWTAGQKIEVRAYKMSDPKPRPEKAYATVTRTGSIPGGPPQVALCLSYYSERNLPRQRGRIYTGPYGSTLGRTPEDTQRNALITFAGQLAGIGGLNVDWSVWSPTTAESGGDGSRTITNVWVDNSWDIVRSRKLAATNRITGTVQ